jgi:hypothetical protein
LQGSLGSSATEAHSDGSAETKNVMNTFYHILEGRTGTYIFSLLRFSKALIQTPETTYEHWWGSN